MSCDRDQRLERVIQVSRVTIVCLHTLLLAYCLSRVCRGQIIQVVEMDVFSALGLRMLELKHQSLSNFIVDSSTSLPKPFHSEVFGVTGSLYSLSNWTCYHSLSADAGDSTDELLLVPTPLHRT